MATRVQTLTSPGFNDASNTPYKGIAIQCYLSTPGGTPVKNVEGQLLFNGQQFGVGTTSDPSTGAISLVAAYVGDLTQPDGSATTCQLVISGANQTIESPVAGYTYAASIDISTWLPSVSTAGTTRMFLEADNTGNAALQNLGIAIDITVTAVKPDGRTIVAGQPIFPFTDANGDIAPAMTPTSLLTPSTARYSITLPGATWYFHVPATPTGYQGAWSSGTTYHVNAGTFASPSDVVLSGGILYQAILDGINHVPPNATYWRVWRGEPIVWNLDAVAITGAVAITASGVSAAGTVPGTRPGSIATVQDALNTFYYDDTYGNLAVRTVTANFVATKLDDIILLNCAGGSISGTVPTAIGQSKAITFIKIDTSANTATITPATGGQTIDGGSALVVSGTTHPGATLVSDQANWWSPAAAGGGGTADTQHLMTTGTYNVLATDRYVEGDCTGGACTVHLPAAATFPVGAVLNVKKWDATPGSNNMVITTTSAQTVDGVASGAFTWNTNGASFSFVSNQSNWRVV